MHETFTLPCDKCGRDYRTNNPQAFVPQWCPYCALKMYQQEPLTEVLNKTSKMFTSLAARNPTKFKKLYNTEDTNENHL